ncbi:FAD-dependent oxidoreductase [Yokenella regensburgei]|uniref:FAD-dependent oxidoreductase n=1 Tax=Yokenella regensburgei TaxID=158877 RepID=UPI0031D359D6
MADDFDIIVIGAGIAGSACALRCARAGLNVLLIERGEQAGSKNLSGGRLYTYALNDLLPQATDSAPLERRITRESLSLLTPDAASTFTSLQPEGDSWSILRARFDPWLMSQAEASGVQCLTGVAVDSLFEENGRISGVNCEGETLYARYVVLAEGANSLLAERHGLLEKPSRTTMALGIKEVLAMDKATLESRFLLEENTGAAHLFSGEICGTLPAGAFLYTNQHTLSLGVVCPLSSIAQGSYPATELLARLKSHPALRPLLRGSETLEYGAHLVPEGGKHSMPRQFGGEGWLLVGDALRTCINTGFTVRGMDTALLSAEAAANALIYACQQDAPQNLFTLYHRAIERSTLWPLLSRYASVPELLQRPGWYRQWPALMNDVARDLFKASPDPTPLLPQLLWRHARRHGLRGLALDMLRSLKCL